MTDRSPMTSEELAEREVPGGGLRWIRHSASVDATIAKSVVCPSAKHGYAHARPGRIATLA